MERCEGRTLLTTYTVTALTDTGAGRGTSGDLRYCMAHANADGRQDTINFAVTGEIQLRSALPSLTSGRGITIAGPGASALTVRGSGPSGEFTMLRVIGGAKVTIADLTFAGGNAVRAGGAIFNGGNLTLRGMTFAYNSAPRNGGALNNVGTMTIIGSTIRNNSVRDVGGGTPGQTTLGNGGGINNSGTLNITDSAILNNSAGTAGGGIDSIFGDIRITNTTLDGNSAQVFGGAISINGPNDFTARGGTLTLVNSTLSNNTAGTTSDTGYGGAIGENDSDVTAIGTTFTGNHSGRRAGGIGENGGNLVLQHSTFTGNTTGGSGGGLSINGGRSITGRGKTQGSTLTITDSTFDNNLAGRNGGGIESTSTTSKIGRTNFMGNTAGSFGGAISLDFDPTFRLTHGSLTIADSTLRNNAAGQGGGGISAFDQLTVIRTTITGNLTIGSGGGIDTGVTPVIRASTITGNSPDNLGRTASNIIPTI